MTRDDIIRMAREAGWKRVGRNPDTGPEFPVLIGNLQRFAALVAEREREACAKLCEELRDSFLSPQYATGQPMSSISERFAAGRCAELIRARGEQEQPR